MVIISRADAVFMPKSNCKVKPSERPNSVEMAKLQPPTANFVDLLYVERERESR